MNDEPQTPAPETVSKLGVVRDLLVAYSTPITLVTLAGGAYSLYAGILPSQIDIPPEWGRYALQFMLASLAAWKPAEKVVDFLDRDTRSIIHELQPESGDFRIARIPDEVWSDLTVLDKDGREVDRHYLHKVNTASGKQAYEVQRYDLEENEAVVSFFSGYTPTEIRRFESSIERIEEEVAAKSAKYDDLVATLSLVVRDAVHKQLNKFIHSFEGLMSMDETSLMDSIGEAEDEYGVDQAELESVIDDMVDTPDPRKEFGNREDRGQIASSYGGGDGE